MMVKNDLLDNVENLFIKTDDDRVLEYEPLMLFNVEENDYMAFLPVGEEDGNEIIFFGMREEEVGVSLIPIDNDAEYELVGEALLQLLKESDKITIED